MLGHGWNPKSAPIFAAAPAAAALRPPCPPGPPVVIVAPASQLALLGTSPGFAVVATGAAPLHYQWSRNGTPIAGATSDHFRVSGLGWPDAANYTVAVSNAAGAVTSPAAELTAVVPDEMSAPPRLPVIPGTVYSVTAYGAVGDGQADNYADAIQRRRLEHCGRPQGGGISDEFPPRARPYLSGAAHARETRSTLGG